MTKRLAELSTWEAIDRVRENAGSEDARSLAENALLAPRLATMLETALAALESINRSRLQNAAAAMRSVATEALTRVGIDPRIMLVCEDCGIKFEQNRNYRGGGRPRYCPEHRTASSKARRYREFMRNGVEE